MSNVDINTFFHYYILNVLKVLPEETDSKIQAVNFDKIFNTNFNDWKKTLKSVLNFSETIDIAIKDLWLKNSEIANQNSQELDENDFAQGFIENYYKKDSKVDVWESENDLNIAKKRISSSYLR